MWFGVALVVLLAACGEVTGPKSPVGTYALSSVDAKPLPATMYADTGYTVEVTAGTIALTADLKYTSSVTTRETVDGNVSTYIDRFSGTWAQAGSTITLTPTRGPTQSATLSGTRLTVTQSDGVFVYSNTP